MQLEFPQMPEKLTPAEQGLLEYIEGNREEFLFMTIGQLALRMHVSEATISRFARHLGCQDFKQLKQLVLSQNHLEGPAGKLAGTLFAEGEFQALNFLRQQQVCLERTMQQLDEQEFCAAIEAICSAERIFIHAKSASFSMAQLLFFRLRRLNLQVSLLPSGGTELLEGLVQAGEGDLVILFGFSKVSSEGRIILQEQNHAAYRTLCFTSRVHIQEEDRADMNLYVYRGEQKEYHSMTAAAALIDALVVAVSEYRGAEGVRQMNRLHRLKQRYRMEK